MLTRRLIALATLPVLFAVGCGEKEDTGDSGVDADGDGYSSVDDCDDSNADVNPGATEVCDDSIDNDCDGTADNEDVCGGGSSEWVDAAPTASNDDAPQFDAIVRTETAALGGFDATTGEGYQFYITEETDVLSGDSEVVCDNEYTLTGTAEVTGDCDDCTFGWEVDATLDGENGSADCDPSVVRTFGEDTIIRNPTLAFWSEYVAAGYYGYYYYENVLANGVAVDYSSYGYNYYPGPYWQFFASTYDGDNGGDYVYFDENYLDWSVYWEATAADGENLYYNYCDYVYTSYAYAAYDGPSGNTSNIACNDYYVDAWEVDLSDASAFRVTVDTIAADSAADLAFWVNDPDGCSIVWADDSFDCTYEPTDWQCPAVEYDVDAPGTYTVYVKTWGYCTGDVGAYDIAVTKEVAAG